MGKPKDAEETLRRAIKQEHQNHYGHYYLALSLNEQGKHREAAQELRLAIKLKSDNYNSAFSEAAALLDEIEAEHPESTKPGNPSTGTIQSFNKNRGFGFILADDEKRRFLHITEWHVDEPPAPGIRIQFEPIETEKGLAVKSARPVEPEGS